MRLRLKQVQQVAVIASISSLCVLSTWLMWLRSLEDSNSGTCIATAFKALQRAGWSGNYGRDSFQTRAPALDWDRLSETCQSELTADSRTDRDEPPVPDHCFVEKLTEPVRLRAMRHLARVADELELAGVDFYLDMGTALGALRHFQMIPYDEDIDLRISEEQKPEAKMALERLRYKWPELLFHDTEWINQHWKVHLMDILDPVLERHVAIDIFFYRLNRTSGQLLISEPPFSFPIGDIFPTRRRPFHGRWYSTPNSIQAMIVGYFPNTSLTDCVYYLHDLPFASCSRPVLPCRLLTARFDFARTIQLSSGQLQILASADAAPSSDAQAGRRWRATGLAYIAGADRL